jgi:hypothetical protein
LPVNNYIQQSKTFSAPDFFPLLQCGAARGIIVNSSGEEQEEENTTEAGYVHPTWPFLSSSSFSSELVISDWPRHFCE